MKLSGLFFISLLLFISAGCRNFYASQRTPQRRSIPVRRQLARPQQRPQQASGKRKQADIDLFETVFHRNPQDFSADSHLSENEREIMRRYDSSRDPAVREFQNRNSRSAGERSDWVFGTRNGSFF